MTTAERESRSKKAQALKVTPMEDDIHRDASGSLIAGRWLVTCESNPAMRHQVRFEGQALARWSCSCLDYRHHREAEPAWACKHIAAVQAGTQPHIPVAVSKPAIGFAAPQPSRIELECAAMFGDQVAIAQLNGRPARPATYEPAPSVEVSRTVQPAAAALLTDEPTPENRMELIGEWETCPACGLSLPRGCTCILYVSAGTTAAYDPIFAYRCREHLQASDEILEILPQDPAFEPDHCAICKAEETDHGPAHMRQTTLERTRLNSPLVCGLCRGEAWDVESRMRMDPWRYTLESGITSPWACPNCRQHRANELATVTRQEPQTKDSLAAPTLASIHAALTRPFPIALVEVKPGAIANGRALALAYVDSRAYQARLDETAGPEGWSVEYRPLGDRAVICRLTILGVTREDVGEADPAEANWATCMIAQGFKRACAAFGLGRYLYNLPRVWSEYDPHRKALKDPEAAIQALYRGVKAA